MGNKASAVWNVLSTQKEHITEIIQGKSNNTEEQDDQLCDPATMPRHPFTGYVPRALIDKDSIHIEGKLSEYSSHFSINLICDHPNAEDPPKDIAYHFKADFVGQRVVANTKIDGQWSEANENVEWVDEEQKDQDFQLFVPGMDFEIVLTVEDNAIQTIINTQWHNTMKLVHSIGTVKYIQVWGDVERVSALKFEFA